MKATSLQIIKLFEDLHRQVLIEEKILKKLILMLKLKGGGKK